MALDRLFAALLRERISHGDFKGHNLFWDERLACWSLIDLDAMQQHRSARSFARAYARDRARFLRNWPADSALHQFAQPTFTADARRRLSRLKEAQPVALTILGLSGALSHDPSAALYIDGKLIAAAEEERFVRDKHAKKPHALRVGQILSGTGRDQAV